MGMKNRNWYLQRILLNFSNDGATYKAVKSIVVNNLTSKGVSCSMENGMTTLANKILDIQSGTVTYDYDVSLNLSSDDVVLGDDIVLTATLNADIDNTTVDLDGEISGATVKFYLGSTLLGTSNTNSQGVATYNYTPNTTGDYTFHSVFDGADDFDGATSGDVTVTVEEDNVYFDSDNCFQMIVKGNTVSSASNSIYLPFNANGGTIDYGDGTVETFGEYTRLNHTYQDSGKHLIKIKSNTSGISISIKGEYPALGDNDVIAVSFKEISQPTIYADSNKGWWFGACPNLVDVQVYGTTSWSVPIYDSRIVPNNENLVITIPNGTTSIYTNKSFPSEKLVERSE